MITIVVLIVLLSIIALIVILLHFSVTVNIHLGADEIRVKATYLGFTLYPRKPKEKKSVGKKISKKRETKKKQEDITTQFPDDFDDEIDDYELMHGLSDDHEKALAEQAEVSAAEVKTEEQTVPAAEISEEKKEEIKYSKKENLKKPAKEKKPKKEKSEKQGIREKISELKAKYEKIKPYIPMAWKYFKKLLKTIRIRLDDVNIRIGREDAHEAAIYYGAVQGLLANLLSLLSEMFTVSVKHCDVECRFAENTIGAEADMSVRVRPSALIAIVVCVAVKFIIIYLRQKIESRRLSEDSQIKQTA